MEQGNVYVIDGEADRWRGEGKGEQRGRDGARSRNGTSRSSHAVAGAHGGWPRLAASLSMWVNGSGHFLHRRWKTGAFYLTIAVLAAGLHALLATSWPRIGALAGRYGAGEIDLLFALLMIDVFVIAALLAGVYSAYALGCACSSELTEPEPHPAWPALASVLVPGWGQIVNGQPVKAIAFLGGAYAGALGVAAWWAIPQPIGRALAGLPGPLQPVVVAAVLIALGLTVWALSLYDAVLVALYKRRLPAPRRASVPPARRVPRTQSGRRNGRCRIPIDPRPVSLDNR